MVPVSEAKIRLHELVNEVADHPVLLVRHSRPEAVLVSYDRWLELRREMADLLDRLALYRSRRSPADLRLSPDKVMSELGLEAELD